MTKFTDEETGVRGVLYLVERMAGQLPDYVGTDRTDSTDTVMVRRARLIKNLTIKQQKMATLERSPSLSSFTSSIDRKNIHLLISCGQAAQQGTMLVRKSGSKLVT